MEEWSRKCLIRFQQNGVADLHGPGRHHSCRVLKVLAYKREFGQNWPGNSRESLPGSSKTSRLTSPAG